MARFLALDQERCTGCRVCEMVCSVKLRLVIKDGSLVGAQALGRTERVGGLLALFFRGGRIPERLTGTPTFKGIREEWVLGGIRRELKQLLGT